jgi:hypothetical protein
MGEWQKVAAEINRRLKRAASLGIMAATAVIVLGLGLAFGVFYLLIRFVHWAWVH